MEYYKEILKNNNYYVMNSFDLNNIIKILDDKSLVKHSYLNNKDVIAVCDENNIILIDLLNMNIITESIVISFKDHNDLLVEINKYIEPELSLIEPKRKLDQQDAITPNKKMKL